MISATLISNDSKYHLPEAVATSVGVVTPNTIRDPHGIDESEAIFSRVQVHNMTSQDYEKLKELGYTQGLIDAVVKNNEQYPSRIWVLDNSGSMNTMDGNLFAMDSENRGQTVQCTRWNELQDCMKYHLGLTEIMHTQTVLRFLNDPGTHIGPQRIVVSENNPADLHKAKKVLRETRPGGLTPLTKHIMEVDTQIRLIEPKLVEENRRVVIIIATDGLPSVKSEGYDSRESEKFRGALVSLLKLPVWVVLRLCTDDKNVVDFYNSLDKNLELSLEVLDDYLGEASEVYIYNRWLNYALPLHRCREFGFYNMLFDLIDERSLTGSEVREFCCLLFGKKETEIPNPAIEWENFERCLEALLENEMDVWNPMRKKNMPWIDVHALKEKMIPGSSCCTIQ